MNESITVSALNQYTRTLIEQDEVLSQVWVEGEISGFSVHQKTGHAYFSLRDGDCSVRAVMFSSHASALRFLPKDGMYVVANCRVTLYERDGSFQINVFDLLPKGVGAVHKLVDETKQKLQTEGLFDAARKRPLPQRPACVGIVTSASSAALQDIISVAARRDPTVRLRVYSSNVQGLDAVPSLIRAIERLNRDPDIDVAIIARGGGSREDLWYFNDEDLVRAAGRLRMPFISAVGHETDYTLIDYVSDARAPTPSAAAEMTIHDRALDWRYLLGLYDNIETLVQEGMQSRTDKIRLHSEMFPRVLDALLTDRIKQLDTARRLAQSLDPMNVLLRGYSRTTKQGRGVGSASELVTGDKIDVLFHDGGAGCTVERIIKDE